MLELIPTILGVLAVLFFFYAMLTRKSWLETKALLADTTIRYEAALAQNQKSEQNSKATKDMVEKLRQQALKAEKQSEDVRSKSSDGKLEAIRLRTEMEAAAQKFDSQREHLLEQVQVLTAQLSEVVREKKQNAAELSVLQRSLEDKAREMGEGSRRELSEAQSQIQSLRRDRQNIQTQFEKFKEESGLVKPEELKRWQSKVARLEQLYASMKGLREMAEERNENWETALRFFALHILGTSATPPADTNIGALVGAALEKIGATLVDDGESSTDKNAPYTLTPSASEVAAETLS